MSIDDAVAGAGFPPVMSDRVFETLRRLLLASAGISLADSKRIHLANRLGDRLRALGLQDFGHYCEIVAREDAGEERQRMVNCATTNKTGFFREAHHFAFLTRLIGSAQRKTSGGLPLRIWSAACSTGEEPYSIAMTALQALGGRAASQVHIVASDIDTSVIETAKRAVYPRLALNDVPQEMRARYVLRGTGENAARISLTDEVKKMVRFRAGNLCGPPAHVGERFDVIFCRNVLIYFEPSMQQRVIDELSRHLTPDGHLVLGHAESLRASGTGWQSLGGTIYRREACVSETAGDLPGPDPSGELEIGRQRLGIGGFAAYARPTEVTTVLGSCVSACLFDPATGVGGMNHFMLTGNSEDASTRYGVHAMEVLLNALMKAGADRRRLKAKVFGGAAVLSESGSVIAKRNNEFVRQFLKEEGIPILAERLGGEHALIVKFETHTGRAWVKPLTRSGDVARDEMSFKTSPTVANADDEEIFVWPGAPPPASGSLKEPWTS